MKRLNVLVACEESQAVCKEFRRLGHRAFSCDLQPAMIYDHLEWHIMDDALSVINGNCTFFTMDGKEHTQEGKWDLLIAHPPCTYLTCAGAANIPKDPSRIEKGFEAKEFFMQFINADCDRIAVENPVPMARFEMPKYTQIIHPYEFGHRVAKRTCLWLKNIPPLKPTQIIQLTDDDFSPVRYYKGLKKRESKWYNHGGSKWRSKTFPGIAQAMAEQWSKYILEHEE